MSLTPLWPGIRLAIMSNVGKRRHVHVIWCVLLQFQFTHLQTLPDDTPHHPALYELKKISTHLAICACLKAVNNE
jgi:hypothetical protein